MAELDYEEIIALSEDPNVTFDDIRGRSPSPEELERVTEVAGVLFCRSSLETQIEFVSGMPSHVAASHLALLSDSDRDRVLSRLPVDLADVIASLLPVGVT